MAAAMGSPIEIDKDSALILSSQRPRLIKEYPHMWVAIYQGTVKLS